MDSNGPDDASPGIERRPISRRLRFEILRRDNYACRYCGRSAPDVPLTVDHVIPISLGGSDDATNLVTACRDCNGGKGSTSPDEHIVADVDAKALVWAGALSRAAEIRRAEFAQLDAVVAQVATHWDSWRDGSGNGVPKEQDWRHSIERFLTLGLDAADLTRFTRIAMEGKAKVADTWRYFCGCCWKEIGRRQEAASSSLTGATAGDPPSVGDLDSGDYDSGYSDGFHDGQGYGFDDGRKRGMEEARRESWDEYAAGFRRGVERLTEHVEGTSIFRLPDFDRPEADV